MATYKSTLTGRTHEGFTWQEAIDNSNADDKRVSELRVKIAPKARVVINESFASPDKSNIAEAEGFLKRDSVSRKLKEKKTTRKKKSILKNMFKRKD